MDLELEEQEKKEIEEEIRRCELSMEREEFEAKRRNHHILSKILQSNFKRKKKRRRPSFYTDSGNIFDFILQNASLTAINFFDFNSN